MQFTKSFVSSTIPFDVSSMPDSQIYTFATTLTEGAIAQRSFQDVLDCVKDFVEIYGYDLSSLASENQIKRMFRELRDYEKKFCSKKG